MTPVGRSSRLRPASEVSARFLSAGGFGYELLLSDDFETCESSRLHLATCEAHWLSARPATLLFFFTVAASRNIQHFPSRLGGSLWSVLNQQGSNHLEEKGTLRQAKTTYILYLLQYIQAHANVDRSELPG